MPNLLQPSPMNPIPIVPIDPLDLGNSFDYTFPFRLDAPSISNHFKQFRTDWQINTGLPYQLRKDYGQKWQFDDVITLQFNTPVSSGISVYLYDCNGSNIATIEPIVTASFAGNIIYGLPATCRQYRFSFGSLSLNTGRYYLVVDILEGEEHSLFISEPMSVKNNHFETILVEYSHDENRYQTYFSLTPKFNIRVEGWVDVKSWSYRDTTFLGQGDETDIPYSNSDRKYDFVVGTKTRDNSLAIPKVFVDIIVNALRCRTIIIGQRQFVRVPNADPEIEEFGALSFIQATFKLLEQGKTGIGIFGKKQARFTFPGTYPYVITELVMGVINVAPTQKITSLSDLNLLVTTANSSLGLGGVFSLTGTTLVYTNAANENYLSLTGTTANKELRAVIKKRTTDSWQDVSYVGRTLIMQFKDALTTNSTWATYHSIGTVEGIGNLYVSGAATQNISFWHNDDIAALNFLDSGTNYYLNSFDDSSDWPTAMQKLEIHNQFSFPTFTEILIDQYNPRNLQLETIIITGSGLINLPIFNYNTPINYFDFTGNGIAPSMFESFTNALIGAYESLNGFIGMIDQNPSAPPTTQTLINMTTLGADGWTFTHD